MRKQILIYDTTLHDSREWPGATFESAERINLAHTLDALGVAYIEISPPSAETGEETLFRTLVEMPLTNASLTVSGRFPMDPNRLIDASWMTPILSAGTPACTLIVQGVSSSGVDADPVAKGELFSHLKNAILDLRAQDIEVLVEVEDFFSGYLRDPQFTRRLIRAGLAGGAERIILNETVGSTLPWQAGKIFHQLFTEFPDGSFGVHFHDAGHSAVPGVLAVVGQGVVQVQGSINGFGRRSGEANLCNLIPELELKWGYRCLPEGNLPDLLDIAQSLMRTASEHCEYMMPYVGRSSFMPV